MRAAVCFVLSIVALLWVAIYNGYPLVWWDTGSYVLSSFTLTVPPFHPVFYSLFLLATHWRLTLWGTVVAQSALIVYLIALIVDEQNRGSVRGAWNHRALLAICLALAAGTALPWMAGQVMADVFMGIAVLSFYYIVLSRAPRHRQIRAAALLLLVSLVVHLSHLMLIIGLTALVQCAAWAGARHVRRDGLRMAWACIAAALVLVPATNWLLTGRLFFSGASHTLMLGRLLADGTVQRLLAEHCAVRHYELCAYRSELPNSLSKYLWSRDSPLPRLGGMSRSAPASWPVIRDAVAEYPLDVLAGTIRGAATQLQMFDTAADVAPVADGSFTNDVMRSRFAREHARYRAAGQQRDVLPSAACRRIDWWVTVCAAALSMVLLVSAIWRKGIATVQLHGFVWAAVLINAAVIGLLSEPQHRYGARLAWLLPFAVLLSIGAAWRAWSPAPAAAAEVGSATPDDHSTVTP
jgi:hypothetical protein